MRILFCFIFFFSLSSSAESLSQLGETNKKINKGMSEIASQSINSNSITFSQSIIVDKSKVIEGHGVSCVLKIPENSKNLSFIEISSKSKGWTLTQKSFEASIVRGYTALVSDYQKTDKILANIETQNTLTFEGVESVFMTCHSRCGSSTATVCAQAYADSLKTLLHDSGLRGFTGEKTFGGTASTNKVAPPVKNTGTR